MLLPERLICLPVVDKPMAAKRDKSIFFISYFVYIVLVFSFFYSFLFCLAEIIAEIIAERNYLKAMTLLRISFLYSFFIPSGRKEASIRSSHFTIERRNFLAMLLITFSLSPDAVITLMKSDFRIFLFLPDRKSTRLNSSHHG